MNTRLVTHSVRDLRDALDAAEHDLANGEPGARFAVNYNRRELESMAYNLAADLIDTRDELTTAQSHLTHALDDAAAERTRADSAEAECARLRAENTRLAYLAEQAAHLVVERNHFRERAETHSARIDWMQHVAAEAMRVGLAMCRDLRGRLRGEGLRLARATTERDAARAEADALRAIIEGRTVPPTPQEIDHHWRMGGAWLVGRSVVTDRAEALRLASVGVAGVAWVALDGMLRGGCPCPWPTVAAEAATGAALAGEGRLRATDGPTKGTM